MSAEGSAQTIHAPARGRGLASVGAPWLMVCLLAAAYLGWTVARLALYDSLTSISDDSSNYLVMARHFSPWAAENDAVRSVWPLQYFPPLFPLVLAISGAAHSLLAAHALVAALGALSLGAMYLLLAREMGLHARVAMATALLVALLPGFLLGLQGVLSEALYLVLSLLYLAHARSGARMGALLALLLGGAMLTRSAGFVLLLAAGASAAFSMVRDRRAALRQATAVAAALLIYQLVMSLWGPRASGEYARIWQGLAEHGGQGSGAAAAAYLAAQARALLESWLAFFVVYWRDDSPLAPAIALVAGSLALCGMLLRLRANCVDAWYAAGSLLLLLLWPYPGQMLRLVFPLVPILLAQAAWFIALGARWNPVGRYLFAGAGLLMALAILPPHAYLQGRLTLARERGLVPVYEWLRKPDMAAARRELGLQNQMLADFARLRVEVAADRTVAYYEPSCIALLAERRAVHLSMPFDPEELTGEADYALITAIHPRQSRASVDGLALAPTAAAASLLWCSHEALDGRPASCLFRLRER